jgi:hypothetical protein
MPKSLNNLLELYGRLEMAVQKQMNARCAPFCTRCASPCCRIDYCREALESPFLEAIRNRFAPSVHWNPALGWLTPKGCGLTAGRPPVCYEFLCRPILEAQPTPEQREALKQLVMLVTVAGRRARGSRHLVELWDLEQVNAPRLLAQMAKSADILARMRSWEGGVDQ